GDGPFLRIARAGQGRAGRAPRGQRLRQKTTTGTHGLVSFAALLGNGAVIALELVLVLVHELLAGVRHHLGAQRLGQVAPDVLVHLGELVHLFLPAVAAAALFAVVLRRLVLLLALLLLFALAAGHLVALAAPLAPRCLPALAALLPHASLLLFFALLLRGRPALLVLLLLIVRRVLLPLAFGDQRVDVLEDIALDLLCALADLLVGQALLGGARLLEQ